MFSIKGSFADCLSCSLFSEPSCILETNCETFQEVEIIFIAENPGKDEVEKGKPLVGKAGKLFRKYFEKYGLNKCKYILLNVVLCQTLNPDGTTGNPTPEVIDRCKVNCFKIIEECNQKLIVLMGASPTSAFGLLPKGTGITNIRGEIFKWNDQDVMIMLHPSYINRQKNLEPTFEEDMKKVSELIGIDSNPVEVKKVSSGKNEVFYYKIPDKYYTSDYKLIDVQFLSKTNEVLYIFRDKNNKKEYYKTNDEYVCYQINNENDSRKTVTYDQLHQIRVPYKDKYSLNPKITYEGDLKITTKHSIDYYLTKKEEEPIIPINVMFLDIETYSQTRVSSNAEDVNDVIPIIGYSYGNVKKSLVLDPKILGIDQVIDPKKENVHIFKSEVQLLSAFISDFRNIDPDFISGWYSNDFDMKYIFNRCKKLQIDITKFSKFGEADYNKYQFYPDIAGSVCLDMLELYKMFTFGGRESYSLDFISKLEIQKEKIDTGGNFSQLFRTDVNKAIDYNRMDIDLLEGLNKKLRHLFLIDELKKICKNSFKGAKSVMGRLDSLIVSFLKEKGVSSKNSESNESDSEFEGAYVQQPITGVHDYIVDFDFTSLYPSIILTYNIGINTFVMKLKDYQLGYDLVYNPDKLPEQIEVIIDPTFEKKQMIITKQQLLDKIKSSKLTYTINGCFYKSHEKEVSSYSEILEVLLSSRKDYKNKMFDAKNLKDKNKEDLYDTRQLVYKVLANALYGILGNHVFRFFNVDCARSITLSGQESIKNVMISAENFVDSKKKKEEPKIYDITKQQMFTKENESIKDNFEYLITGDTDSVFVSFENIIDKSKTKEEILKDIFQLSKDTQNFLNNVVVKKIVEKHNIPLNKNRLQLKNELVVKRGLFLAKKRYANYIISVEGNPTDEIKGMGLETKRSDFANTTKEYLKEVLDLILKSETLSIPRVLDFVKEKNDIFTKIIAGGNTVIGRPVSFGKKLKEYKTLTQGIRGMLAWNNLEYKVFDVGSRGYLFKLKGIDLDKAPEEVRLNYNKNFLSKGEKLDVLVIPEEVPLVPNYYIIDVKEMLQFSWKDRCDLLLDPLIKVKQEILKF